MKKIIIIIFLFSTHFLVFGQDKTVFSFQDCLNRAIAENIDLKIKRNIAAQMHLDEQRNYWQFAPTINGGAGSSLNLRRSTNQNNEISSGRTYNVNYSVGSSLTLFRGFSRINAIAAQRYLHLAFKESTQYALNMLYINLLQNYTEIVIQKSLLANLQEKLDINIKERERIKALIEQGQLEAVAKFEMDAAVSSIELQCKQMENQCKMSLIQLAQFIEWTAYDEFDISSEEFQSLSPEELPYNYEMVYASACENMPEIKQIEYNIEATRKNLSVQKGYSLPSISVNGGYGSGFYSTDTLANGSPSPFGTQFSKYLNPGLSMSMSIPIFNGFNQNFNIRKSKLDIENKLFELEKEKRNIGKEIIDAIQRLEAFRLEYETAQNNLFFTQKSFEAIREQFQLGLKTSTDFDQAQNKMEDAKNNVISAKYSWLMQHKLLELYMGKTELQSSLVL